MHAKIWGLGQVKNCKPDEPITPMKSSKKQSSNNMVVIVFELFKKLIGVLLPSTQTMFI